MIESLAVEKQMDPYSYMDFNKYPLLNTKNVLYINQMPNRFLICTMEATSILDEYMDSALLAIPYLYGEILSKCNGNLSIKQIAEYFEKRGEDRNRILSFLENAIFKEWVSLNNAHNAIDLPILGSSEYFYPMNITVELTDACNLKCKHCYRDASYKGRFMPTKQLFSLIDTLAGHGLCGIELTGGEPLMHPDFLKIVQYAAKRLDLIGVLTNGTLIDEDTIETFLPYRDKMLFSVSIDSSDSKFHDDFRGQKGSWEKSTKAASLLGKNGFITRIAMSVVPR